jgi:hypothetical protein
MAYGLARLRMRKVATTRPPVDVSATAARGRPTDSRTWEALSQLHPSLCQKIGTPFLTTLRIGSYLLAILI